MNRLVPLGLVVAVGLLASACGDSATTCTPSTCSGCCTSTGKCVPANQTTASYCGKGGGTCSACAGGQQCTNGACGTQTGACNATSCPSGCCQGTQCLAGDDKNACGTGGGYCLPCQGTKTCAAGKCVSAPCNATSNPTGCCYNGAPFPGDNPSLCGKNGAACAVCKSNEQCTNHVCTPSSGTCDATICAKGCCQNGACQPGTGVNACGKGGLACVACPAGQQCLGQTCQASTCGPANCLTGCCDKNGACVSGTSEPACGKGGVQCQACGANQSCGTSQTCVNVTVTCSPTNCPTGCCDKNSQCQPGNLQPLCGKGGGPCQACVTGQACSNQTCACTASSCSTGCCQGTTCRSGNETAACGTGGAACQACPSSKQCSNHACSSTCSHLTCYGCCDSQSVCHDPPNNSYCGYFGLPCQACSGSSSCDLWGGVCNTSSCSGSSCTGCCMNGQCKGGTQDSGCGEYGVGCEVCGGTYAPHLYCGVDIDTGSRECLATSGSTWDVLVSSVEVKTGTLWDEYLEGDSPPELKVLVRVGSKSGETSPAAEGYFADFGNAYMFTASASDLITGLHFEVWDDDIGYDDLILSCDDHIFASELKLQETKITTCTSDPQNAEFISITFRFRVKSP